MRRLIKDTVRYLPSQVLPAVAGLIAIPLITRASAPEAYGEYAVALATMNLLLVCTLWVGHAVVRLEPSYRQDGRSARFTRATVLATVLSVATLGAGATVVVLSADPVLGGSLTRTLLVAVLAFAVKAFSDNLTQLLRAQGRSGAYSVLRSTEALTATGAGLALLYASGSIAGLFWGVAAGATIVAVPAWATARRKESDDVPEGDTLSLVRSMARFGLPLTVAGVATWVLALSDRYLVAAFASAEQAGLYAVGYSFAQKPLLLLATAFLLAYRPIGVELYEQEGDRAAAGFLEGATRLFVLLATPIAAWLAVAAVPIVLALSGEAYRAAATVMPLVAVALVLFGVTNFYQEGLGFTHRTGRILAATAAAAAVNVGLNVALIPRFGMVAAAWNTVAAFAVLLGLTAVWSRQVFTWQFPTRTALRAVVAGVVAAAAGAVPAALVASAWPASIVSALCIAFAYGVSLVALGELSVGDVQRFFATWSAKPREAL